MRILLVFSVLVGVGCTSEPPQKISGTITRSFPSEIVSVKVTTTKIVSWHGNAVMAEAPVGADGTFSLDVLPQRGLRLEMIGADGQSHLVFPRQTGSIDGLFAIRRAGADFDLGLVHYVGANPPAGSIVFSQIQCQDGEDDAGHMCVDDNDDQADSCGDDNNDEGEHEDGGDDQGEHDDGESADDGDSTTDPADGPSNGEAISEHTFPADGCNGEHNDGEHDDGEGDDGGADD